MKIVKDTNPVHSTADGGVLFIEDLILHLNIGVTEEERAQHQKISISYKVYFHEKPKACDTDDIDDAICYDSLSQEIAEFCQGKEFKLIEHLCNQLHLLIKSRVGGHKVYVKIKKWPQVKNLSGATSFELCG